MKKVTMIAAALCAAAVTQVSAMEMTWTVDIFDNDTDYNAMPGLVQLFLADNTLVNQMGGTEALSQTATFRQGAIGDPAATYNWLGGQQFYFKVYNDVTVGSAAQMITTALFTMPTYSSDPDNLAEGQLSDALGTALHNQNGAIFAADSRWGANPDYESVPEPASMALFGIGAGVLALRRRLGKKAA